MKILKLNWRKQSLCNYWNNSEKLKYEGLEYQKNEKVSFYAVLFFERWKYLLTCGEIELSSLFCLVSQNNLLIKTLK